MRFSAFYFSTLVFCAVIAYFQWSGKLAVLPEEKATTGELALVIAGVAACAALFYYINSRKQK